MTKYIRLILLLLPFGLLAQMPKTDVYMAEIDDIWHSPKLTKLTYLNHFNQNGYNNQARFVNDQEIYLTVATDLSDKTDIYALNPGKSTYYYVTQTQGISEFSAIPYQNSLATVRIEADGTDQSLWLYPMDRSHAGSRLFPALKNIGYFAYLDENRVALFLVGKPHQLAIGDIKSSEISIITENIGRCLKTNGKGILYFVDKTQKDIWVLKQYDTQEKTIQTIQQMPTGSEDFDLTDGLFITTQGSKILSLNGKSSKDWEEIMDFSGFNISNINRPSVYKNKIIFINNK